MIECTNKKIWKKRRKIAKKTKVFLLLLIISVGIFLYYRFLISNNVINICKDFSYSYVTETLNNSILNNVKNQVEYEELINVSKNNDGDITLISVNSYKANLISKKIANSTQNSLKTRFDKGIPVPSLAFTGIGILSGLGSKIYVKIVSVTSVLCDFDSTFKSVGINQTLHSIYVKVNCELKIATPLNVQIEKISTPVLLNETVLVGKVPSVYLNGNIFSGK